MGSLESSGSIVATCVSRPICAAVFLYVTHLAHPVAVAAGHFTPKDFLLFQSLQLWFTVAHFCPLWLNKIWYVVRLVILGSKRTMFVVETFAVILLTTARTTTWIEKIYIKTWMWVKVPIGYILSIRALLTHTSNIYVSQWIKLIFLLHFNQSLAMCVWETLHLIKQIDW